MDLFDLRLWPEFPPGTQPALIDQIEIDSRRIESPHSLFVALPGSKTDGHLFLSHAAAQGAKFALVKKNCPHVDGLILLRVEDPLAAFQEIAALYRRSMPAKIIIVGGTYGKTMVKDLLHVLLEKKYKVYSSPESFNSQIGVPLSLIGLSSNIEFAVIEAGFSMRGEAEKLCHLIDPDMTVLTHLGVKHLTTLGSIQTSAKEMAKLLPKKGPSFAPNHPALTPYLNQSTVLWNTSPHASSDGLNYEVKFGEILYKLPLKIGKPYYQDLINIAIKPALTLGVTPDEILDVLSTYSPEPSRTEIWQMPGGARLVNETYGSDPQSIDAALKHFAQTSPKGRKIFIFGGVRNYKESFKQKLAQTLGEAKLDRLSLFGTPQDLESKIKEASPATLITSHINFAEAAAALKNELRAGDMAVIKGPRKLPFDTVTEHFQGSVFTNQCHIHLGAVSSNLKTIKRKLPLNTRLMVMVKAHAYGTNETQMAHFLADQGIDLFGVSYVDEAIILRKEGIKQAIFVLNAAPYESAKAVLGGFEIAVSDIRMTELLQNEGAKQNHKVKVHLHVDTGMSRLGCRPEEALKLALYIAKCPNLQLEGIMTHFACADDHKQDSFTIKQSELFDHSIESIEKAGLSIPWKHACNSSGILRFHFKQYNMARTGLAIYGLSQGGIPAISLTSRIVGINHCNKGETISYGRNYQVTRESEKIAVIPVGYFDGMHLNYSSKGEVMIHGQKAPIVGRICMDYLMADVTEIKEAVIGDQVLIFGEDDQGRSFSPHDLAQKGQSSVYELITCLGPRIQRIFIHEDDHRVI